MADIEKAIRILEGNYKNFVVRYNGELITVNELLALLKAQEPVVPIRDINGVYNCGNCETICVGYEVEFVHGIIKVENYCHKCGRKVKWE